MGTCTIVLLFHSAFFDPLLDYISEISFIPAYRAAPVSVLFTVPDRASEGDKF